MEKRVIEGWAESNDFNEALARFIDKLDGTTLNTKVEGGYMKVGIKPVKYKITVEVTR